MHTLAKLYAFDLISGAGGHFMKVGNSLGNCFFPGIEYLFCVINISGWIPNRSASQSSSSRHLRYAQHIEVFISFLFGRVVMIKNAPFNLFL